MAPVYYRVCNTYMTKTPVHSFRAAADLVAKAKAKAAERGETVSDVIRKALERYVKK